MKTKIPAALHNPDFRFFKVIKNKKLPLEKAWNTTNCYMFFDSNLLLHTWLGGNVGICTGYGGLIVIDFDDKEYQELKEPMLPATFTVKTACKGLHHKYYYLEGDMIAKIGIDIGDSRVADIQAGKDGIICPPSRIDGKAYEVVNDIPIANITTTMITEVFDIKRIKQSKRRTNFVTKKEPELIQVALEILKFHKIERTNDRHFKCFRHPMHGNGNLHLFSNASLYCFHCQTYWRDIHEFIDDYLNFKGKNG